MWLIIGWFYMMFLLACCRAKRDEPIKSKEFNEKMEEREHITQENKQPNTHAP
tara:strand:+ start:478 stop:636 length:159 start_codon:yes stop_codon:yes gene_type:complete